MGYIKLHRKLLEWEWYGHPEMTSLWLHLLLSANWEDKIWRGTTIERGSLITSIRALSKETGLSVQQVRTALKKLQKCNQIVLQTSKKSTHNSTQELTQEVTQSATHGATKITICNYDTYQGFDDEQQQTTNTQSNNQTTHGATPTKETKNINNNNIINNISGSEDKTDASTQPKTKDEEREIIEHVYSLYPTKCPIQGRRTGKSSADKKKIATLLKTHTREELERLITAYLQESIRTQTYIMDFSKFLNRLPDYTEQESELFTQQPEEQKKPMTLAEYQDKVEKENAIARQRFEEARNGKR